MTPLRHPRWFALAAVLLGTGLGTLLVPILIAQQPVAIATTSGPVKIWDGIDTANVASTGGLEVDSELSAATAITDNFANPTVPGAMSFTMCWDGATWDRCSEGTGGAGLVTASTAQVVMGAHAAKVSVELAFTAAQTDTAIVAVTAGTRIVVTAAGLVCDHANTVDVGFRIGFGTATTPTTTGVFLSHPGLAAGSGYDRDVNLVGADNEDVRITAEVPTTGSCRALVTYYTI